MNQKTIKRLDKTALSLIHEFCLQGKTMEQILSTTSTNWHYRILLQDLARTIECHTEAINGAVYRQARSH